MPQEGKYMDKQSMKELKSKVAHELPPSQEEIDYLKRKLEKSDKELEELRNKFEFSRIENLFLSEKLEKVSKGSLKFFEKVETFVQLYENTPDKGLNKAFFKDDLVYTFSKLVRSEKNSLENLIKIQDSDDLPF